MSLTSLQCPKCAHIFRLAEELLHPPPGRTLAATCPKCQHKTDATRFVEEFVEQDAKDRAVALEREIKQKKHDRRWRWYERWRKRGNHFREIYTAQRDTVHRQRMRKQRQKTSISPSMKIARNVIFLGKFSLVVAIVTWLVLLVDLLKPYGFRSIKNPNDYWLTIVSSIVTGLVLLALGHILGSLERLGKKTDLTNRLLRSMFEADNQKGDYQHPERENNERLT